MTFIHPINYFVKHFIRMKTSMYSVREVLRLLTVVRAEILVIISELASPTE